MKLISKVLIGLILCSAHMVPGCGKTALAKSKEMEVEKSNELECGGIITTEISNSKQYN